MKKFHIKKHMIRYMSLLIFFNVMIVFFPCGTSIPECPYGVFDVWMSLDGQTWLNTTVNDISLFCGQPFYIKAMMKPTIDDIWLALFLFEPGTMKNGGESFKVLEGPCELNDGCDLGKVSADEIKYVTWKLQVNNDPLWIGGLTPLSITGFFQKKVNGSWVTKDISFSIGYIYINESCWSDDFESTVMNDCRSFDNTIYVLIIPAGFLFFFITGIFTKKRKKK